MPQPLSQADLGSLLSQFKAQATIAEEDEDD